MIENDISYSIRGAAFKIHSALGPGLLESSYVATLACELKKLGHDVKCQVELPPLICGPLRQTLRASARTPSECNSYMLFFDLPDYTLPSAFCQWPTRV